MPAPPAPVPALSHGETSTDVAQLVADFYGDGLSPDRAVERAAAVLRAHPNASAAHEVAAWAELLRGNTEGVWLHSLRAAADLDSDVPELYLPQLGSDFRSRAEISMRLLDEIRVHHPRPSVRINATAELAQLNELFGHLNEAEQLSQSIGYIDEFQLLGSLDNEQGRGFLVAGPPEQKIDLAASVEGPLVPLRWRWIHGVNRLGAVPLSSLLWPNDSGVAYLATWAHVDAERTGQLRVTSDCATRAFVNDGLVLSEEQVIGGDVDNLIAPIGLHAGWNQILIKVAERRARPWAVRARISAGDGAPLPGVTYSATPAPYRRDPPRAASETLHSYGPVLGPIGRKDILEATLLSRAGQKRRALPVFQKALDRSPHNPLFQYLAAMSYWDNEETGKTIDLLTRGVQNANGPTAAFLTKRGRYYAQQRLFEQAHRDLRQATSIGDFAEPELADLLDKRGWQTDRCRLLADVVGKHPDAGWALRERAECLDAQGYLPEAERSFELATAMRPGDRDAWSERLQLAFRRGDFSVARKAIDALEGLDPNVSRWLVEEGELDRRMGRPKEALARFAAATRTAPEWPRPWERIGNVFHEAGAERYAIEAWERARARDPDNAALSARVEFLAPTRLGFIEKWIPHEEELDRTLHTRPNASSGGEKALLLDHEVTEIGADGSATRVVTQVAQALDDKGRDAMTLQRLPQGGTKILRAYAIDGNGDQHEASSIRDREVRFRNLQVGSRTVLQYVSRTHARHLFPGAFAAERGFQSTTDDLENSTWIVVVPRGTTLHREIVGPVDEEHVIDGDREVFTFHAAHVQRLEREPSMPPLEDVLAHVAISTTKSWDDVARWQRALLSDARRSDSVLDALTDRLVASVASPREKLDRLFRYVTREIRYQQDYESIIAGVRPHAAPVVLERGYGDCKDKAVLLMQMARRVGISVHFAILRTTNLGHVVREVPTHQFNHAIAWIPKQEDIDEPFFLDPTADGLDLGNVPPTDQGALALVIDPDSTKWEFREIPYQAPELQYDRHAIRVRIASPTEATLTDELSLRGGRAMYLRQLLHNHADARKELETIAAMLFPAGTVKDISTGDSADTARPLTVTFHIDDTSMLHAQEGAYRFSIPGNFDLSPAIALSKRVTSVVLGPPDSSVFDLEIALPDGYEVSHVPHDFTVVHPCFTVSRTARIEGNRVRLHTDYVQRCSEVAVPDYANFRDAGQHAAHELGDDLVFRKGARGAATAPYRTTPMPGPG